MIRYYTVAIGAVLLIAGARAQSPSPAPAGGQAQPKSKPQPEASMMPPDKVRWAAPVFVATPSEPVAFKEIIKYTYRLQSFTPPFRVEAVAKGAAGYKTPEEAMIARTSALMAADVDWWLSIWDQKSRDQQKELLAQTGRKEAMTSSWKDVFAKNRLQLLHKVTYGNYVIVTYRMVNVDTGKTGDAELPVVFKNEGGVWRSTNDLHADAILLQSPWIDGRLATEVVVK